MSDVDAGPIVILGGGHAGFQVAAALRQGGCEDEITVIDAQRRPPYQRPPLSKAYLLGAMDAANVPFRCRSFYDEQRISYICGDSCVAIDRSSQLVVTRSGRRLPYGHLVLALGAEPVRLPVAGVELEGVHELRTWDDSDRLREVVEIGRTAVVVGGGFIGLEVATALRKSGAAVTVLEAQSRLMPRAVSPVISDHCKRAQESLGTKIRLDSMVVSLHGAGGRVSAVELASGETLPADRVIIGIGVRPSSALAREAGLEVGDGIVVDEYLQTSDPRVSAIGDCCTFPAPDGDGAIRLESVQNATDHARAVAARLLGRRAPYRDLAWFWSEQGGLKLQMAGVARGETVDVVHGDVDAGRFSVLRFLDDRLVCGESVNSPGDHVSLRTLVAHSDGITPERAADPRFDLKATARALRRQPA